MILRYNNDDPQINPVPQIAEDCFVAENATVVGRVKIGSGSSVWYGAVIRADEADVEIGENSNVQDNAVLHVSMGHPVKIGNGVTIGHGAIVHGATVKDNALIGMGAIVLNGAVVGENAIVGAGALVKEMDIIPDGAVAVGVPAKVKRIDAEGNRESNALNSGAYTFLAKEYKAGQENKD